ncbi:MAG: Xaa-Pro peptidase family protein [Nitrospirota bacterium]|nr:Xaa-Pro peptidase family protein [Nitrospirota bacterium]
MIKLPISYYFSQLTKIRESIKRQRVDAFLVTDIHNVRYLTGFSGSSGFLFITESKNILITDFRYKEQAGREVQGWDIVIEKRDMIKTIKRLSQKIGIKKLGFESSLSYNFFRRLSKGDLTLKAFKGLIERLRVIKDALEIDSLREAVRRAESAFLDIKPYIKKGISERAIALRLEERLKKRGCRHIPFEVIVASGSNSAMPHAKPTEKKLNKGDLVIIDWGGEADGYLSDMTRTVLLKGGNLNKKKEIYQLVLEANKRAISFVSPGISSKEIDHSARNVIEKAGYGEFFGHGTGHGVGLQVHESPHITMNKKETIKENMVFTIEPGIYVPGFGGVRIEDMVVVKSDGSEVLTSLSKKLKIINEETADPDFLKVISDGKSCGKC